MGGPSGRPPSVLPPAPFQFVGTPTVGSFEIHTESLLGSTRMIVGLPDRPSARGNVDVSICTPVGANLVFTPRLYVERLDLLGSGHNDRTRSVCRSRRAIGRVRG